MHTCMCTHTCARTHTKHTHAHTYTRTHTKNIHMHAHTHAHTHKLYTNVKAASFIITKTANNLHVLQLVNGKTVVYPYNGYYSAIKNNELLIYTMWKNLNASYCMKEDKFKKLHNT